MTSIRTHYDNLKVSRSAPQEVIRAAYKTLTQKYHPDRNPDNPDSVRIMTLINTSYEVLSDAEKRRQHDAWIAAQEQGAPSRAETQEPQARQPEKSAAQEFVSPHPGAFAYANLPASAREKLKNRVSGKNKEQLLIKNGSVVGNYIWSIVLLGWFVYLFVDAGQYKWGQDATLWMLGPTGATALFLAINISCIVRWHVSPLRSWLIVSPLYIIKTEFDRVWYWPNWTLTKINATHNYRNGVYNGTTVNIAFGESKDTFSISPEAMYTTLVNRLKTYDGAFRTAIANGNVDYLNTHDDFAECHSLPVSKAKSRLFGLAVACYAVTFIIAALLFVVAFLYNSQMQSKPAPVIKPPERSLPYTQESKAQPTVTAKPSYTRPKTAPNGTPWPKVAGYVPGFKQLNQGGHSQVTIDNTRNDSDVFVKLVDIGRAEAFPVRVFFIPKGGKFTLSDIKVGRYDVRYRDLDTGGLAKSEQFQVEENRTYNGVEYTDMTMTLYKVRNGNMKTYSIPESEF
jgi:hypothetical protein